MKKLHADPKSKKKCPCSCIIIILILIHNSIDLKKMQFCPVYQIKHLRKTKCTTKAFTMEIEYDSFYVSPITQHTRRSFQQRYIYNCNYSK